MNTSIDVSKHTSLAGIAEAIAVTKDVAVALECPIYVTGAFARDLWLEFVFPIGSLRRTEDVDFAVQCADWPTFERLSMALIERGLSRPSGVPHRFRHPNGIEIDLLPYGGLERPDRTIAWPPDGKEIMSLLGFEEVRAATETFRLPNRVEIAVVRQFALALLKLIAWDDRGNRSDNKDATDLYAIGRTYLATRLPRVDIEREQELLSGNALDATLAGAELLGADMATVGASDLHETVRRILDREAHEQGPLRLAHSIQRTHRLYEIEQAAAFLAAMSRGYSRRIERS